MTALSVLFDVSPAVFLILTVVFMGGCAAMTGHALARSWRPAWQIVPYGLLLGGADRFLAYAMFHGDILSLAGYLRDAPVLLIFAALAFRITRVRQMVEQYPWLYQRSGLLGWRERNEVG